MYKNVLKDDQIILLKGENGRNFIEDHLKKEGFNICILECYKRVLKSFDSRIEAKKWRLNKINTLIATSGEILYQLKNIISDQDQIEWLLQCQVFVISNRLSKIAKHLGWKNIIVAKHAHNESLLRIIKHEYFKKNNFFYFGRRKRI
ncbi:uroporphyrinogen-III synthase [Buchnera aphidicola]|uniref:uroporphyrinogen-III synthase n=1 Tax=Buchnera aphidicola TaxID=9 RepID=UPI0021C7D712|nr:uroporphyrinogen-III synthase [Buchnera aphidicola]